MTAPLSHPERSDEGAESRDLWLRLACDLRSLDFVRKLTQFTLSLPNGLGMTVVFGTIMAFGMTVAFGMTGGNSPTMQFAHVSSPVSGGIPERTVGAKTVPGTIVCYREFRTRPAARRRREERSDGRADR